MGAQKSGRARTLKSGASHEGKKSPEGWSQGGSGQKGEAQKGGSQQISVFLFLVTSSSTPFLHTGGSVHGMLVVFFLLFQLGASETTFGAFWSSCEPLAAPEAQTGGGPDWRRGGPGEDGPLGGRSRGGRSRRGRSRRGRSRGGRYREREGSVWERVLQGDGFQRLTKQQKSSSEEEEEDSKNKKREKREKREKKRKKQEKKHQKKKKNTRWRLKEAKADLTKADLANVELAEVDQSPTQITLTYDQTLP